MPLFVAEGPAMYLGGSVETFALPMAAFIVVASMLLVVFRRPHSISQLKYSPRKEASSVRTAEPGEMPAAAEPRQPAGQGKPSGPGRPSGQGRPTDAGSGTATGVSAPEGKE